MSLETVETVRAEQPSVSARPLEYLAFSIYAALTAVTAYNHEPWEDEANSWLLGRDASIYQLWTRLMHYEGTPALWQTLLHVLIRLGFPYSGLNFFTGALGCAAAWMFMRKAPLPLPIRLAMPFTFYLFYQYSIVARSYCLLPVLLFLCAWMYPRKESRPGWFTALLCLMAGVSAHGMILSGAIWVSFQLDLWRKTSSPSRVKRLSLVAAYGAVVLLLAWSAWPAQDDNFAKNVDSSFDHLLVTTGETLENAFTGSWIASVIVIALSIPFLLRGRGLLVFAVSGVGLLLFNGLVYANYWHEGILCLAWLFALWISGERATPGRMAMAAMAAVITVQCYWSVRTAVYDWKYPYSGSKAAARYLRENGIFGSRLFGSGYPSVGVQPYFATNIFPNFGDGDPRSYYDWSDTYRNFDDEPEVIAKVKPEYFLVGYKNDEDRTKGREKVQNLGYRLVKTFDGSLYWHDDVIESDGFDLYRRN